MNSTATGANAGQRVLGLGLFVLLAVAITFRIIGLDHLPGMNGDEVQYADRLNELRAGLRPALVTGSGLPLNPFYSGLLWLFQAVWPTPSFWIVRLPALFSGLTLVVLAYPLLVRVFDRPVALATALLLACLPMTIAYSRFGWDQSQAPLASLLCLYFGLQRQLLGTIVALVIAVIVHPLNMFLTPIALGPLLASYGACWRRLLLAAILAGLAAILVFQLLLPSSIRQHLLERVLPGMGQRLVRVQDWGDFALHWGDLLTGTTIYRYIVGPVPGWSVLLQRLLFWAVVVLLLVRGLPALVRQRNLPVLGLLGGLAISMAAFYLLAGLSAIKPGQERYATFLLVPSCLALVLLARAAGTSSVALQVQAWGLLLMGGLLLAGFWQHYFAVLLATGGDAHRTFRTGPVEPKQAAFEAIVAASQGEPVTILAEDWWCYFSLHYLANQRDELRVQFCHRAGRETEQRRRFVVGFAEGPCDHWLRKQGTALPPYLIRDAAGRPVLYVWDLGTNPELLPGLAEICRHQVTDLPQ